MGTFIAQRHPWLVIRCKKLSDFGFGQGSEAFDFAAFGGGAEEFIGPYIPEARDCMSCGACVSGCPTYKVRPEENYGPRGRVRMIERVIRKQDLLSAEEREALEACTLCRACESVCPSKMAYAELYLQASEALDARPQRDLAISLVLGLADGPRSRQRLLGYLLRFYQWSGLHRALGSLPFSPLKGGLKELQRLLPVAHRSQPVPDQSPAETAECLGELGLFTGCMANILDTQTHNASIRLLTRLGYAVRVMQKQTCCGATYAHNSEPERARDCARRNQDAFGESGLDAIIHNASGCGAFLNDYTALLDMGEGDDTQQAMPPVTDVMDFLLGMDWPGDVAFRELHLRVAVHEPCSQRNALGNAGAVYELLAKIPGLEVIPLPGNEMCCGAGGTKMITQPELALPLRDEKVNALLQTGADLLVSTNLSCALHLAGGLRESGHDIEVMHPVRLLAQQLK